MEEFTRILDNVFYSSLHNNPFDYNDAYNIANNQK